MHIILHWNLKTVKIFLIIYRLKGERASLPASATANISTELWSLKRHENFNWLMMNYEFCHFTNKQIRMNQAYKGYNIITEHQHHFDREGGTVGLQNHSKLRTQGV